MSWVLLYTVITSYGAVHTAPHHGFTSYESCIEFGNGLADLDRQLYGNDHQYKVDCEPDDNAD